MMVNTSTSSSSSSSLSVSTIASLAFLGGTAVGYLGFQAWSNYLTSKRSKEGTSSSSDDDENMEAAGIHLWKIVEYSMTGALIFAGDKLDIYNKLYLCGPISVTEFASKTGYSERWLKEFLLQSTAAGICTYINNNNPKRKHIEEDGRGSDKGDDGKFSIKSGYAKLLRGPRDEPKSIAGMFQFLSGLVSRSEQVSKAIQTGDGFDYDYGSTENISSAIDRKNGNFFRYRLIDEIISKIKFPNTGKSLICALEDGGLHVADVGCGCGASTIALAKKFPKCYFYAYESSPQSLELLRERIDEANILNISICDVHTRTVGDGPILNDPKSKFDFVYAHDVLHDMTNPRGLIKDVKKRLSANGCWCIVDVDCANTVEENLQRKDASINLAFSCLLCLAMATSEPDAEGLGTCGFTPKLTERWMKKAGFTYFERRKIKSLPGNACYLVG